MLVSFNRPVADSGSFRLHIGGEEPREGWKILNVQAKPHVDFIGNCTDLSQFATASVDEIYASHVYEHLGYQQALPNALAEAARVLKPGGIFRVAVPDIETLSHLFVDPDLTLEARFHVMRMMFGGQIDAYDFHYVGLSEAIFSVFLARAGFASSRRVQDFGLFQDCSVIQFAGKWISLNMEAVR